MRLSSIGHASARFDDVTLDFTDQHGRPVNSVLWLRNGGGKTSLLSLFFAGIRPGKRDFLGQRADEKIRRLPDYVGPRDHGVVVCEWELDADRGLFDDSAPRYLSGVFYERKEADGGDGDVDVDRLFFATLVSTTEPELTLDGLPLYSDHADGRNRRTLSGFRRRLRQLDQAHPGHNVFIEDKNQGKLEEELASHGIDPEVFFYQIRMNEREGGVSERFSFAEDEDFVDFLLEMTFDQRHARQVREQLSTFRQEIVERNEQLKPELEYCQGLVTRLHKLAGISHERVEVFRQTQLAQAELSGLLQWTSSRMEDLKAESERLGKELLESRQEADKARRAADTARRLASVNHREACRLRLQEVQAEYDARESERQEAKRQKAIWRAAVPLARVWDARREAARLRNLLRSKLQEFAPDLERLTEAATCFANALEHAVVTTRKAEASQRSEATRLREQTRKARDGASAAGERAVQDETHDRQLENQLAAASREEQLLREQEAIQADEPTADGALVRISREVQEIDLLTTETKKSLEETDRQQAETRAARKRAEQDLAAITTDQKFAQHVWDVAIAKRKALEADGALLRLLQTEHIDVEAAATGATAKATEELRRVTDAILRIGVEAAEDERAIHELDESGLLPPTQDVESLLDWLRQRKVAAWSGWEYIEQNVPLKDRRGLVERLPHLAAGIVVANSDYERLGDLFASADDRSTCRFRSPLVVAPADAITGSPGAQWMVVGPTSDAHFDKGAGAKELSRLLAHKSSRQKEIEQHQEWHAALADLKHRLQQYQADHPRGWFRDQRQKLEILASRLDEANQRVTRLATRQAALEGEANKIRQQIQKLSATRSRKERDRDRLEQFNRSFGSHLATWKSELAVVRDRAAKSRLQQTTLHQEADESEAKAQYADRQAQASASLALQMETELSQVKYCEASTRKPEAGPTEELRSCYQLLLADYEGKVNADSLSHMASAKEQEADTHDREFRRVMQQLPDISDHQVEGELRQLPEGMSAQVQQEDADVALEEATRKLGPLKNRLNSVAGECEAANKEYDELAKTAPLPALQQVDSLEGYAARVADARKEEADQVQLAEAFDAEVAEITKCLTETSHESDKIGKDRQRLESIRLSYQQQLDRLAAASCDTSLSGTLPSVTVQDSEALASRIGDLEKRLNEIREKHHALDERRDTVAKSLSEWSRQDRFGKLRSSICHRFLDRDASSLEAKAEFDIGQLGDYVFQIEEKLKEADKQRDIVIHVLSTAVDEALSLLARLSRLSRLPDRLPQADKQFLKIETKASENPAERRVHIGELVDELLERGDVGDGLQLIQKAVRRVARRITARVLHPDLHQKVDRVSIADMRRFSGGERLTSAILLFCALLRLRQSEANRRIGSSVLILDNPIGTASRLSFLEMQREVASAMNVQLIYATAVNDLNAVGALENVIRLRNARADRRTGRQFIEVDRAASGGTGQIDAARVVFDTAPSSMNRSSGSEGSREPGPEDSEASDEKRLT
jgi:hypothetical protein